MTDPNESIHSRPNITEGHYTSTGLTKREYFAAMALQGLIAKIPLCDRKGELGISKPTAEEIHAIRLDVAQSAVDYADALIAELNKEHP